MNVPPWPQATTRERELLDQVLESDRWGGYHPFVAQLEESFAAFQHCRHAIAAMNGTVTLEMMLEGLELQPGDEVIVPAITFVSTATAVSRAGALPVFVDIDPATFQIDPECVKRAITDDTSAIFAVHFGGSMADMDRLFPIAKDGVAFLLEDAAHAHGSEWNGRKAGSIGLAGSFSFQNSKVMTAGEGGAVTTNDETYSDKMRAILDLGRKRGEGWFFHYELGSNFRMSAFQAAVLLAQLERLPEQNRIRERNASLIRRELRGYPVTFQHVPDAARVQTNYLLLGIVKNRDVFCARVRDAGIPCTPFYPHPLYGNPLYKKGGCRIEPCPVAEARIHDAFWLPHRVLLGDEEQTFGVIDILKRALE